MSVFIDGLEFEIHSEGLVETYERPVKTFVNPSVAGFGAQIFGERGELFELMLRSYAPGASLELGKRSYRAKRGRFVSLTVDGVNYRLPQHGAYRFFVEKVEIKSATRIPRAVGHNSGGSYDHKPAARFETVWTLRATK